MTINSKQKGKTGELEWCKFLKEHGIEARRSQQYCGKEGDADCVGLEGYHQEVKRVEALNINKAIDQAKRDCNGNIPIVAHRKNRSEWLVTMRAEDWVRLIK